MRTYRPAFIRFQSKARFARIILFACLVMAAFLFVLPATSFAQTPGDATQNFGLDSGFSQVGVKSDRDLQSTIARIINIGLGFLGVVAVIIILYAGYLWMTAGGNEEQVSRAKLILRNAVIGLVIILSSWAIAAFVISRLSDATGGGGLPPGGGGGGLPPGGNVAAFRVDSFETAHGGTDSSQDVYLCSSVQAQFNHWLNDEPFDTLKDGDTLTIKRDNGGTFVDVGTIEVIKRNNVISFKNLQSDGSRLDWTPNSNYEVRLDATLADTRGLVLSDCAGCGGQRDGYYYWSFSTGTESDPVPPALAAAYPSNGDTNVPRSTVFSVQFSEAIDVTSVINASGELESANITLTDTDSGFVFPSSAFDVTLSGSRLIFFLNQSHNANFDGIAGLLEPYTTYELTIKDVEDLCGNALAAPVTITFTTGADVPGVSFVRPSDGYVHACPATPVFLKFNTSMYNVRTQSCGVNGAGNAGLVLGGSLNPAGIGLRSLPEDNFSGSGNPNDFCREYRFNLDSNDVADDLIPGTEYAASVHYIAPGGDVANPDQKAWSFTVAEAGKCAQEPYITYVSGLRRNQGQWQQCLTVQGAYFGGIKAAGSRVSTTLSLESPLNIGAITAGMQTAWPANSWLGITDNAWQDKSIAADFIRKPDSATKPIPSQPNVDFDMSVEVAHPTPIGTLKSNTVRFTVDTTKNFTGPCLYSINPISGYWGTGVTLSGSKLGGALGNGDELIFYNNKRQDSIDVVDSGGSWSVGRITAKVPDQAQNNPADGEVYVTVGGVQSNKLEFNIAAGVGQSCSSVAAACSPDPGLCSPGLECAPSSCTCQVPDTFRIINVEPKASCTDSCTSAVVSFEANMPIGDSTGNKIQLKKCTGTSSCSWDDPGATLVGIAKVPDGSQRIIISPTPGGSTLDLNSRYIVRVLGGSSGLLSADNKQIANVNANTDATPGKDAYVWSFKTGKSACAVSRIELNQGNMALYEGDTETISARAYSISNSCASGGQEITPPNNFTWKTCEYVNGDIAFECRASCSAPQLPDGRPILSAAPLSPTSQTTLTAQNGRTDGTAKALACALYGDGAVSLKDGAIATVYAACNTDSDCQQGSACPASVCIKTDPNKGRCTPVINDFNPKNGASGTWVTIDGCYFGNARGRVDVGLNPGAQPSEAIAPQVAWCGATWSDTQIIAEVAADAINDGRVRVTRPGFNPAISSVVYDVNSAAHPGICRVSPLQGRARAIVDIRGQGFGSAPGSVVFVDSGSALYPTVAVVDAATRSNCPADGWDNRQVCIRVVDTAASGAGSVKIVRGAVESNSVAFTVLGNIPGGSSNPNNLIVTSYTPGAGANACLNMLVEVTLSGVVVPESVGFDPGDASVATANFYVRRPSGNSLVAGITDVVVRGNQTILRLYPTPGQLVISSNYQIVLKGGASGLQSTAGGVLATDKICDTLSSGDVAVGLTQNDCVINFRTVDPGQSDQCRITLLEVTPANQVFTCAGRNNCEGDEDSGQAGHQRIFTAVGKNNAGQTAIVNSPLAWSSSDESVLLSNAPFSPTLTASQELFSVLPISGGVSVITAAVDIAGADISGSTEARVLLCENPWPTTMSTNGVPFQDKTGDATFTTKSIKTNFSTFYCRDQSSGGLLPSLELRAETGQGENADLPNLLKEIFFVQPNSKDAIGIRVLKNPTNLTARDWYDTQPYRGSPQAISPIDGFEAIQDGRTIYVAAPNDTKVGATSIYNNIYLISINDNAAPDSIKIFNQIVANWKFLVNITDAGKNQALRRDALRIKTAHTLARLLDVGTPPLLASGSFARGLSLSVWPSWGANLSTDFGTSLPHDPAESIVCDAVAGVLDPATCRTGSQNPGYACNSGTQAYMYVYRNQGGTASFSMNLEYAPPASWNQFTGGAWNLTPGEACMNYGLKYIK